MSDPEQMSFYGGLPPHEPLDQAGTSFSAALSMAPNAGTLRSRVLALIRASGDGMTDDELEAYTGLRHQTVSARRRELVLGGFIRDSGRRRMTRSRRMAAVWVAT